MNVASGICRLILQQSFVVSEYWSSRQKSCTAEDLMISRDDFCTFLNRRVSESRKDSNYLNAEGQNFVDYCCPKFCS